MLIHARRPDRVTSNEGTRTTQLWKNWIRGNIKKESVKEKEPCQVKDEE